MKKKLKVLLYVILLGVLLICLTGCGDKDEKEDKKDNKEENVSSSQTNDNNAEDENFEMGSWTNDIYTNDFLGLSFVLPDGWTAKSEEEIAEMMDLGAEVLEDEGKYISEVSKLTSAYYASATDTLGNNIIIMSEKPAVNATVDQYMSSLKSQLVSLTSMTYEVLDEGTATLGSKECKTLTVKETSFGIDLRQKYYVYKQGSYFIGIIVTSVEGEDTFTEVEKNFK